MVRIGLPEIIFIIVVMVAILRFDVINGLVKKWSKFINNASLNKKNESEMADEHTPEDSSYQDKNPQA